MANSDTSLPGFKERGIKCILDPAAHTAHGAEITPSAGAEPLQGMEGSDWTEPLLGRFGAGMKSS